MREGSHLVSSTLYPSNIQCRRGCSWNRLVGRLSCSIILMFRSLIPAGDKCGATFVDRNFLTWLEKKLGSTDFKKISPEKLKNGGKLMREFETIKTNFNGDDTVYYLQLPPELATIDDNNRDISQGELEIKR